METEYISRQKVERFIENGLNNPDKSKAFGHDAVEILTEVHFMDAADVWPLQVGENITENNPVDEFVCSKCGIILEDWSRVEIDEDDGERTNHEYAFRFCPNCGAKMGETP